MKIKGKPKKIIKENGDIEFYCPDCGFYLPLFNENGERNFPEWKAREVGTYCRKHHAKRQAKRNPGYYEKNRAKIYAQQIKYRIRTGRRKPINEDEKEKDV
jgi:hypothetical protein